MPRIVAEHLEAHATQNRARSGLCSPHRLQTCIVQGHPWIRRRNISTEGEDTEGQFRRRSVSPEPLDAEQGLYLAVTDSEEDVTGQRLRRGGLETEEAEGQGRGRSVGEDDAEGQVYRQRGPGGEDGKGSV